MSLNKKFTMVNHSIPKILSLQKKSNLISTTENIQILGLRRQKMTDS